MSVVAIILTFNEEHHIARCIGSLQDVVDEVVVVDSLSGDATVRVARDLGARVLQHEWSNHAAQFNWALEQLLPGCEWILRIDADEYLTPELAAEMRSRLPTLEARIDGVHLRRHMMFQGRLIRHGGLFPVRVLRLFRFGRGRSENRWMDEHIVVAGATTEFAGRLIDDNLGSLTRWTAKHNRYASLEAAEMLNLEFGFAPRESMGRLRGGSQAHVKRWIKEAVYARLPAGLRAWAYFLYRYLVRLGFLDGAAGARFHLLQGFWYRYLVDAKIGEVKRYMSRQGVGIVEAIERVLEVDVSAESGR